MTITNWFIPIEIGELIREIARECSVHACYEWHTLRVMNLLHSYELNIEEPSEASARRYWLHIHRRFNTEKVLVLSPFMTPSTQFQYSS